MKTYRVYDPESDSQKLLTMQVTITQAGPHQHDNVINKEA